MVNMNPPPAALAREIADWIILIDARFQDGKAFHAFIERISHEAAEHVVAHWTARNAWIRIMDCLAHGGYTKIWIEKTDVRPNSFMTCCSEGWEVSSTSLDEPPRVPMTLYAE